MSLQPGSFVWLLAHDMRLSWRGFSAMFRAGSGSKAAIVLALTVVGLHLLAWPAVRWLTPVLYGPDASLALLATGIGAAFTWMIAQSVFAASRTLYDRADLDLLLGSPLPASKIVAAKALAIATGTMASIAIIVLPIADMGIILDGPAWFGIYPALAGLALIATSLGLVLTMGLFVLVGPRRARVYAQLTGASLGGAFVLGAQVFAMLPAGTQAVVTTGLAHFGIAASSRQFALLLAPIQAVRGQPEAMVLLLASGIAVFALTIGLLGKRFAMAAIATAGADGEASARGRGRARTAFGGGAARSLRVKELRLLSRDPSLFAQLGLQIIYTIPIAVVLLRSQIVPAAFALVPTIVMIAAQVAGSIAWVTVSGEDAPELIATAPVQPGLVNRAKLGSVFVPVLMILALPLAALAIVSWKLSLIAALFAVAASGSTALLNFWHPMPGNRRGMLRRHSQSKLIGLVEHGLAMLWAFAVVFAMVASTLVVVPLAIVAAILTVASKKMRRATGQAATP